MEENIFELLGEWDSACFFEDKIGEREAGRKIALLRKEYRERQGRLEKIKAVGHFHGSMCNIFFGDRYIASIWNLKYTGRKSIHDNTCLYTNEKVSIWLDYAVYE